MRRTAVVGSAVAGTLAVVLVSLSGPPALAAPGHGHARHDPPAPPAAGTAPGAPGAASSWTTGAKDGLGTSAGTASKVWFSLASGAMSEVYYPRVDIADVTSLQLVVTDGRTFTDREDTDTTHRIQLLDRESLSYRQIDTDKDHRYRITKTYTTDPGRNTVLLDVSVTSLDRGHYTAYVLYDPSLANSGKHDSATTSGSTLLASDTSTDTPVASALRAEPAFTAVSSGYADSSDGWTDLATDHTLDHQYASAPDGNVVQIGRLAADRSGTTHATIALGFGADTAAASRAASGSLRTGFGRASRSYDQGWSRYLGSLDRAPRSVRHDAGLLTQYDVAVMTLRAHEDKTYRGANIASLTVPWGEAVNADEAGVGGYHLVWARDLYEVATAQMAAGDTAAANRSLDYLFDVQQKPDGSFPQNSRLDGTPYWGSLQLDEVAFPIVLASQLGRDDAATWSHVKRAADFIVGNGPATPQERWEEEGGYSPSTIAAEIAGLVSAASIARANGDEASGALYLATADDWQRSLKQWTVTTTGPLGDGHYFIRIDDNTDPNDGHQLDINNGGGSYDERSIVDAGFLELVRLGVLPADDPDVVGSLPVVDSTIRVQTPEGPMWYRYNHDGYGEKADGSPYDGTGVGRLWPLLSGERGEYSLAAGGSATSYLRTMAGAANAGYMIPEQVWDQPSTGQFTFGEGTGSATPLAWSMAQFVRLARSIDAGRPVETPTLVRDRYVDGGGVPQGPSLTLTSPADGLQTDAATTTVAGSTDAQAIYVHVGSQTLTATVGPDGTFSLDVPLVLGGNTVSVVAVGADGGTTLLRRTVVSTNLGTQVGALTDPTGDDHGPGSYTYPASGDFVPGAFDLTRLGVYRDGDQVNLALGIAGALTNPWGGNQISTQRFDIYLRGASGSAVPALPGTNADLASPYSYVITADGWSSGVKDASGATVGSATLRAVPQAHELIVTVPASVLGGVDLATAGYAVTAMSHADDAGGEGLGGIRPVYDGAYWASTVGTDMSWIHDYRFGGGAGQWTGDNAAKDTDTSDPNVLDIFTPAGSAQSTVLDWRGGSPVVLPYVGLG
ncbi:glucan 1,4-alpha-glucosidase [Nocardioides sp. Iso805N]|uniref:glucan 1,4-alpha-glucosidase n=1 Tax=Nocardioides sp. Iso805N TaxID=1283287 RepID=UPI00035ECFFD|nr:glucan 1,4-alpha-glucosidase [Nocardioides sp. Iso805N]